MKTTWFGGILLLWLALGPPVSAQTLNWFAIRTEGTDGLKFTALCQGFKEDGSSFSEKFEGRIPDGKLFWEDMAMVSCVYLKRQGPGHLKVILMKGTKTVSTGEATAAYGAVSISGK